MRRLFSVALVLGFVSATAFAGEPKKPAPTEKKDAAPPATEKKADAPKTDTTAPDHKTADHAKPDAKANDKGAAKPVEKK